METPPHPQRKSIRYAGYDYRRAGAYFVTICATNGNSIFGKVVDGTMMPSPVGEIAYSCWSELPTHFSFVMLDSYVIMPNHMHGLLWLHPLPCPSEVEDAHNQSQTYPPARTDAKCSVYTTASTSESPIPTSGSEENGTRRFGQPLAGSLSTIVSSYKAAVTRQARRIGVWGNTALWHGRFWDRIVRDDIELNNIRTYIIDNPNRWISDQLHPDAPPNRFNRWTNNS